MEVGLRYFGERLGVGVDVAYNVDSFGHTAFLPSLMREQGFRRYVMMRPGPHEKALPAPLFRWRAPDGAEVVTWRIPRSYCTRGVEELERNVQAALAAAAALEGVPHVMCFYGVGDHGGGPTQEQIDWIRGRSGSFPDAELVFSDPQRFFAAAAPYEGGLPVVADELQYHAIGCYSVVREIKVKVRRAERALLRAGATVEAMAAHAPAGAGAALDEAWKPVLFIQFHDTLGGSAIAEAYADAGEQLGRSCATADDVAYSTLFRSLVSLPADPLQRIVAFNPADTDFDGALVHEPWLEWSQMQGGLLDEGGREVAWQAVQQSDVARRRGAILWRARIPARGVAVWRLAPQRAQPSVPAPAAASGPAAVANGLARVRRGRATALLASPRLELRVLSDATDTWSHGVDRYSGRRLGCFRVTAAAVEESGPLRATLRVDAAFGASRLTLRASLLTGDRSLHLDLLLHWAERQRVAKLVFALGRSFDARLDGVPGGSLARDQDGREVPFRDWTLAQGGPGIVAPDCFALDGQGGEVRFTLVRSPVFAWHDPHKLAADRGYRYTDQGEHAFRFVLVPEATEGALEAAASALVLKPICLDWTRGMGG
jgi:alpha-mannosidase